MLQEDVVDDLADQSDDSVWVVVQATAIFICSGCLLGCSGFDDCVLLQGDDQESWSEDEPDASL